MDRNPTHGRLVVIDPHEAAVGKVIGGKAWEY
jgi:hypothetical protein